MPGAYGGIETLDVEAASLFDACDQAIKIWCMLSCYNRNAILTVRSGEQEWKDNQDRVREFSANSNRN